MPRVSIIMGIYNCEDTLEKAIQSILLQTYEDWELIMCDDCSSDGTLDIASKYAKAYPGKIVVLRNTSNKKLAYSLNRCLEIAKGEYVARMDSDDTSLPNRLKSQVLFLDEHPEYQVVSCRAITVDEYGNKEYRGVEGEPLPECMLNDVPFIHPTIMMRKEAYDVLGGYTVLPRTERGQDLDLWFRFFSRGFRGYVLGEALYQYSDFACTYRKKYSFKMARCYCMTRMYGYKLLGFPKCYCVFAFKPLVSCIVPWKLKQIARNVLKGR